MQNRYIATIVSVFLFLVTGCATNGARTWMDRAHVNGCRNIRTSRGVALVSSALTGSLAGVASAGAATAGSGAKEAWAVTGIVSGVATATLVVLVNTLNETLQTDRCDEALVPKEAPPEKEEK